MVKLSIYWSDFWWLQWLQGRVGWHRASLGLKSREIQSLSLRNRSSCILGATHGPLLSSSSQRADWAPQSQSCWLQLCGIHIRPKGSNPPQLLWRSSYQWVLGLKDIKKWACFIGFHVRRIGTSIHHHRHYRVRGVAAGLRVAAQTALAGR